MENNLSETAFFIPVEKGFHIRWYTPETEVNLCGHATLAAAHVLFRHLNFEKEEIRFESKSGLLTVKKRAELLVLNFPASKVETTNILTSLKTAFGIHPHECFMGRDELMLVFKSEKDIEMLDPNFLMIIESNTPGVICTSTSKKYDFVSRFFAPAIGINEDPVTGSAHTMLIPYWSKQLKKTKLSTRQLSKRRGILHCKNLSDRVEIGGKTTTYMIGKIIV